MSSKPTLVFVPGAWHGASTWDKVISLLKAMQYKCIAVTLPSTVSDPSATFTDDIHAVQDAIVAETSQGRDVVVVVHSYGGAIGSSALKGLTQQNKDVSLSSENPSSHVIGLVMMATGFITTGLSFINQIGGKPPPFWKADSESGYAVIVSDARQLFYHDLPMEEGIYWVGKLAKQSLRSLMEGGEDAYAGWKEVPVWYLATADDKTYPLQAQRLVVQIANNDGGNVTLREVESSHSPMLSKPSETVEFILEAVTSIVGQKIV